MSDPTKKVLNKVEIEHHTHGWLIEQANLRGTFVNDFAGELLDIYSESELEESLSGKERQRLASGLNYRWFQRRDTAEIRARKAAAMHLRRPTEESKAKLEVICKDAQLNMDQVVNEVVADPFAPLLSQSETITLKERCILWLPSFILNNEGSVASSVVYAAGREMGFSSSTIDRARQEINSNPDVPRIESDKRGVGWTMSIRTNVQDEHHQHQQRHKDILYTM